MFGIADSTFSEPRINRSSSSSHRALLLPFRWKSAFPWVLSPVTCRRLGLITQMSIEKIRMAVLLARRVKIKGHKDKGIPCDKAGKWGKTDHRSNLGFVESQPDTRSGQFARAALTVTQHGQDIVGCGSWNAAIEIICGYQTGNDR